MSTTVERASDSEEQEKEEASVDSAHGRAEVMAKLVDESSNQPLALRVEFGGRSERRTRGQIESRGYGEARSDGREMPSPSVSRFRKRLTSR